MIKIILYSESDENIKKIQALLEARDELSLLAARISQKSEDKANQDDAGLLILDLSGLSKDKGNYKNEIKKINGLSAKPFRGKLLIIDPSQQAYLFDELLFANDFLFIGNLEKELLPRIDFLLYKLKLMVPADSLVIGDMVLNMEKYELMVDNRVVVLTFKEFEMLKLLMQNKDKVFTRINLLSTVWGYDYYGGSRTVDVHMRRLRSKIPPPYNNMLKTIRNVGYMFSPEE
jgi:hypothetical protein